jgi:hypothetical protein
MVSTMNTAAASPKSVLIEGIVAPFFSVQIETIPAYIGTRGMAKAIFKPAEGFKWNKDYPTTFNTGGANLSIAVLLTEEINLMNGKVCVPYLGNQPGRIEVKGRINFSICNKKECLIFRNEKITLTLIILENNDDN